MLIFCPDYDISFLNTKSQFWKEAQIPRLNLPTECRMHCLSQDGVWGRFLNHPSAHQIAEKLAKFAIHKIARYAYWTQKLAGNKVWLTDKWSSKGVNKRDPEASN